MKRFELLFLVLILFFSISCGSTKSTKTSTTTSQVQEKITGKFVSKKGVMVTLSCYCYDCGHFTTTDGKKIDVCFKTISSDAVVCPENVSLTGNYKEIKINPESGGVCSSGVRKIFMVESVECN